MLHECSFSQAKYAAGCGVGGHRQAIGHHGVCNPVQKSCILTACSILVEWYSCFVQDFKPTFQVQPVFTKSLTGSLLTFFGTPPSAHAMWRPPHPRCFRGNHITVNKTCYFTLLYGFRRVFEPLFFFSDE